MPLLAATREIVVLSPPGIIKPSHFSNSAGVRTSMNVHWIVGEAFAELSRRSWICSLKAPWRARTPIVISIGEEGDCCVIVLGESWRREVRRWVTV